ncbi:MAG: Rieske 2Fe-2S domain-containing protein [Thermoleophilia bacterium]|nr:Rieske 2Fe-2S domain-containing protein [Thermoleophilia bacterium]
MRYAYPVAQAEVQPKQQVGQLSTLTPLGEALFFDYLEAPAALILQADSTPKAFYLACTHFGCIVKWRVEEKDFFCPCHAGVFAPDGTVLAGPRPPPGRAQSGGGRGPALRGRDGELKRWTWPPASSATWTAAIACASLWSISSTSASRLI